MQMTNSDYLKLMIISRYKEFKEKLMGKTRTVKSNNNKQRTADSIPVPSSRSVNTYAFIIRSENRVVNL